MLLVPELGLGEGGRRKGSMDNWPWREGEVESGNHVQLLL